MPVMTMRGFCHLQIPTTLSISIFVFYIFYILCIYSIYYAIFYTFSNHPVVKLKHDFSCELSADLPQSKHSHTSCNCLAFHHCGFPSVFSNCLPERMQSHIGCICLNFPHCALLNVSSNGLYGKRHSRIGYVNPRI